MRCLLPLLAAASLSLREEGATDTLNSLATSIPAAVHDGMEKIKGLWHKGEELESEAAQAVW